MILRPAMPRHALAEADRAAYLRHPEGADDFWDEAQAQAQAWGEGEAGDATMRAPARLEK